MSCGHPNCKTQSKAVRECRHPMCTQDGRPVHLCKSCDEIIHRQPDYQGHLVLDIVQKDGNRKLPDTDVQLSSNLLSEDEPVAEPEPDYPDSQFGPDQTGDETSSHFRKHQGSTRMSSISKRLKRKDAVKRRTSIDIANQSRTRSKSLSSVEIKNQFNGLENEFGNFSISALPTETNQLSLAPVGRSEIQFIIDSPDNYINIPTAKGKTIQDLLGSKLNVDITSVDVYLASSNTPLPLGSLSRLLEGNRVYLKDKESRPIVFNREKDTKKSPQIHLQGLTKQRRVFNYSLDDTSSTKLPTKAIFTTNKYKDKDKLEQMFDILKYSVSLLPPVNSEDVLPSSLLEIENSWRDIVRNASDLPKQIQSQQEVIWELLSTEITYIESLQVITNLFMSCLQNIQRELPSIMKEIETEKLFSNIVEVFAANSVFWKKYLCEVLKVSRETHNPINPSLLKDGFTKFPELFKPYQRFCAEQIFCQNYIKSQCKNNEYFKNFVIWAERNTDLCKRLRLIDIIITPMQRLTRYSLLLRRIKEKSIESKQKEDLEIMIKAVDNFVSDVNMKVGQKRERDKLNAVASRIDSYEGVEAPNEECVKLLNVYNQKFTLTSPMPNCHAEQSRILLHQCSLKLKDSTVRQDVECYLFTDILLICKLKRLNERLRVLKPPIRVDQISIEELKDKGSILVIQTNEYTVPTLAFTLHADQSSIRSFISHINKAKIIYNEANQNFVQWQQHRNSEDLNFINIPPKLQYQSSFQEGKHDKLNDPCPSPKYYEKHRPNSFSLSKHKHQNSYSEQIISPRIVCESPSPETQMVPSLLLPNTEMKTSVSMPSCASDEWLSHSSGEESKGKSERKRKTEKRYNTADSIQELKRKEHADNTIHKRFSWNSGSTHKENRQGLYKHVSSDSIRSSSGVSSTCSSHLSPDQETNENYEEAPIDTQPSLTELNETENFLTLSSDKTLSKSMPDIAALLHDVTPSEMKDGISSVDITSLNEMNYEGLSHIQIMNIKKYLLLNSNNESEV
ncbi:pleckstrin homology domain-containing family G member 5-like [Argonauta hians]